MYVRSWVRIPALYTAWKFGHFFTLICCKICIVCLKRSKRKEKEARVGPFYKYRWSSSASNFNNVKNGKMPNSNNNNSLKRTKINKQGPGLAHLKKVESLEQSSFLAFKFYWDWLLLAKLFLLDVTCHVTTTIAIYFSRCLKGCVNSWSK